MIAIESGADRHALVAPTLRLRFAWVEDRWTHALDILRESSWACVARSFETSPEHAEADPSRVACPSYQQIHLQEGEDGAQALLVGLSGPHHFSAVFAVRELEGATMIDVDVADRCRTAVSGLAATYRLDLTSADLADARPDRIAWELGAGGRLAVESMEVSGVASRLALSESGRGGTLIQAEAPIRPEAATHRLLYRWRRESQFV